MEFVSAARESQFDDVNMPLHISAPKQSCFRVMESADFNKLNPKDFREIFLSQAIITVDEKATPGEFSMASLLQFQSLSTIFDIEGMYPFLTCHLLTNKADSFSKI